MHALFPTALHNREPETTPLRDLEQDCGSCRQLTSLVGTRIYWRTRLPWNAAYSSSHRLKQTIVIMAQLNDAQTDAVRNYLGRLLLI